jgi:hypothetical protein
MARTRARLKIENSLAFNAALLRPGDYSASVASWLGARKRLTMKKIGSVHERPVR